MKKTIILSFISILAIFIFISCEKEDKYKDFQKFSTANPVCGDYVVNWYQGGTLVVPGTTVLSIYNTANNSSQIWVDDNGAFWTFKTKANLSGSNFSITNGIDVALNDTTTIKNGSVTGNNIYLELIWASDPTNTYVCKGTRRTGFE